jgi:tetratricopeptide (TPR) repeat protein
MAGCQFSSDKKGEVSESEPSAISLFGEELYPLKISEESKKLKDSLLHIAFLDYENDPQKLENIIWYGRRLAYLDRYDEAVAVYTQGMEYHPEAPELYRHRGHRFITTRHFDNAIEDFLSAEEYMAGREIEIEQDGLPNKMNIPLSNLQFNVYYHLGLAYFLQGQYAEAEKTYLKCMEYSINDDLAIATSDWLFMTYMREDLKDKAEQLIASIPDTLELVENDGYYRRIKMYKGLIEPDELVDLSDNNAELLQLVTQGYGVANYLNILGDSTGYKNLLNQIIATGYWPAFGFIAAEADLYRMKIKN